MPAARESRSFRSQRRSALAGLYFHHPSSFEHDPREHIEGHPDTPDRIVAIEAGMEARDWLGFERRTAPAATDHEMLLAHSPGHLAVLRELDDRGGGRIDQDTAV